MNFKKLSNKTRLSVTFLLALSIFIFSGINTTKVFASVGNGSGTNADPYIITSVEQLSGVSNNLSASYKLANDIDLHNLTWIPIGNNTTPFIGNFDGNGYAIQNLKINQPSQSYVGLFGSINNATVKNLSIVDANIIGSNYTGGLSGYSNINSTISNCSVTGSSTITGSMHTGGLVGYGSGLIDKCFTTTDVTSQYQNIGGLVGSADSLIIKECFTTGNIKASSIVGGIVGRNISATSKVIGLNMQNCYSLSNIEATQTPSSYAGGLLGYSTNPVINYCYFAGTIKSADLYKGALIGYTNSSTSGITNNFYDGVKSGLVPNKSYEISSRLTSGMTRQQSYPSWNFDTIWAIDENTSYPYFKNLSKPSGVKVILPLTDVLSGKGSVNDPYTISTKEQLNNVKFDLTASYKLINNIDLENIDFVPIGNEEAPFTGTFDGNGYAIQNLKINQQSRSYVGLFGSINNATVKNLSIVDANIIGSNYTGGLSGYSNYSSTISNCSVTGSSTITGSMHTGGLVGYGSGLIDKCFTTTDVTSQSQNIGGLVGSAYYPLTIKECFTTGNIKASSIVGGIVGRNISVTNNAKGLNMQNCYSLSNIEATQTSSSYAGGLLGHSKNDTINCCYFAGTINGADLYKGALIGYTNSSTSDITNDYFDTNVTGFTSSSNAAKTTIEMKEKNTFVGWDFANTWAIDEGSTYPYFKKYDITTPINLITIAGDNVVDLSWNLASNAGRYEVKKAITAGGPYTTIATTSTSDDYSDTNVINGTTYYYIITALNDFGGHTNSNEVAATPNVPKPSVPDAPTNLISSRDNGVYLWWHQVQNATGYNIKRSLIADGPYTNLLTIPTEQCYFYDNTAEESITYYYVVTAVNANGEGNNSNETCANGRYLNISMDGNAVKLAWTPFSGDVSYSIKKSTISNGTYSYIATDVDINTVPNYISLVDNNVNSGTRYYYIVETKSRSGDVQSSGEISITP